MCGVKRSSRNVGAALAAMLATVATTATAAAAASPTVTHLGTSVLTTSGRTAVSYSGLMNGESFQQGTRAAT
ncbi:hypothetical protein GCM10009557_92400 [Virgisporangium ochraceum]